MEKIIVLNEHSPEVQYLKTKDKRLSKVIDMVGSLSYVPHTNGYAFLIHEIIEQMLSIKAGQKIYERVEKLCNGDVNPQTISTLSEEQLRETGTSTAKVRYIKELTHEVISGNLNLSTLSSCPDDIVIKRLTAIRGIGNWTAKMYLIFVLNRPDVLPLEDGAFLQTYKWLYKTQDCSVTAISKKCAKWKPYSSIAARYFYRALDMGFTKETFHLYK